MSLHSSSRMTASINLVTALRGIAKVDPKLEEQRALAESLSAQAEELAGLRIRREKPHHGAAGGLRGAQAQARKLAAKPISSLVETKRLMKSGQAQLVAKQMAEEGVSFGRMLGEPAAKEAFTAFMERRKPDFSKV